MDRRLLGALMLALGACSGGEAPHSTQARGTRCTTLAWLDPARPVVTVSVEGQELAFLVDTGADQDGWIKPEVARRLGLPVVGTLPGDEEDDPTAGLALYDVASLEIGGLRFADRRLGELPAMGGRPLPFDGVIGTRLLADLQVTFDYRRSLLQLTDLHLVTGEVVEFDRFGIPILELSVGESPVKVHLDTGNLAAKLFVPQDIAAGLPLAGPTVEKGRAASASGVFPVMEAPLAVPVRYGATTLAIDTVRWPGPYGAGQLGSAGLVGQTVRVDGRSRRVSIRPESTPPLCPRTRVAASIKEAGRSLRRSL